MATVSPSAVASLEAATGRCLERRAKAQSASNGCLRRTHAAIARSEIDAMPAEPAQAVDCSVLGKVLYEPVLTAIRRLAHQSMVGAAVDLSIVESISS